jgi:hypothetical protein
VEKNVVSRFVESVDRRHAEITAVIAKMLAARAEYYRAYYKCAAALLGEFGIYKVTNGQFIFPIQYMADRYNVAASAMTSAAARVAELEEQRKTLAQPPLKEWQQFIGGK